MMDVSKFNASNRNLMHLEEEEEKKKYRSIFPDLACGTVHTMSELESQEEYILCWLSLAKVKVFVCHSERMITLWNHIILFHSSSSIFQCVNFLVHHCRPL